MPRKGVQVLAHHLPRAVACNLRPLLGIQVQRGQHLERHLGHLLRHQALGHIAFEAFKRQGDGRQLGLVVRLADQPGKPGGAPFLLRLGVHHLHHIGQRRLVANGGVEQLLFRRRQQPLLHQLLGARAQRFAAHRTAAQNLHKVAQHLAVVHHTGEHLHQQLHIAHRQGSGQSGRHVLHIATLAGIDRRLGHKGRLHLGHQLGHLAQLFFGAGVKGLTQAAGQRHLCQLVTRAQAVCRCALVVVLIGSGQQSALERLKQLQVDHGCSLSWHSTGCPVGKQSPCPASPNSRHTALAYLFARSVPT